MYTYLAIFFSLSLLLIVFVRRWIVMTKKADPEPFKDDSPEEGDHGLAKKRISRKDREEVSKLFKRGLAMLKDGKDDEAIKCFVRALAIDEVHIETQHRLATLYLQKQMYGAAAALFKKLGDFTGDPVHYSHLGLALYQQSAYEEARDAYQKAVSMDPSRPQRFISLAQVYRAMGQLNNSLIALRKAVEIDEENLEFLFLIGDVQAELGDKEAARTTFGKILTIDPKNKEARVALKKFF